MELVAQRASELPVQFYWGVFDPLEDTPQDAAGLIADDIGDIYRDIACGVVLFDSAREHEAQWEWGFTFRIHWGEHAIGAIRALHAFLVQEDPDALSSDA